VVKGSPAAKAGIEPGDVILKFNGKDIASSSELPPQVAAVKPGTTATLEVWHDHATRNVEVTIGAMEEKATVAANDEPSADKGRLGVAVRPLSAEEKQATELANGVVVENVGGAAAKAGIRSGDVIVSVNNVPVKSVEQLKELVSKAGKTVALLIQRDEARIFVPVPLG